MRPTFFPKVAVACLDVGYIFRKISTYRISTTDKRPNPGSIVVLFLSNHTIGFGLNLKEVENE